MSVAQRYQTATNLYRGGTTLQNEHDLDRRLEGHTNVICTRILPYIQTYATDDKTL